MFSRTACLIQLDKHFLSIYLWSGTNLSSGTKWWEMRSLPTFAQSPWRSDKCDQCSLFTHSLTHSAYVLLKVCSVPAVETCDQGAIGMHGGTYPAWVHKKDSPRWLFLSSVSKENYGSSKWRKCFSERLFRWRKQHVQWQEQNNNRDSKMFPQTNQPKLCSICTKQTVVSGDGARGRSVEAGDVREGLLEEAGLEPWRRGQASREAKEHMLVAAWHTGQRPRLPALADHLCDLGEVSGPWFPKCKVSELDGKGLTTFPWQGLWERLWWQRGKGFQGERRACLSLGRDCCW